MKMRLSHDEIKFSFSLTETLENLTKIEDLGNLEYFADKDIMGYPWWEQWRKDLEEIESKVEKYGSDYQRTKDDADYGMYSLEMGKLDELKREINADVEKYKAEYKKVLIEKLVDAKETFEYNISEVDKEIVERERKVALLQRKITARRAEMENYEKYQGIESDEYKTQKRFLDKDYADINATFKEINDLKDEKIELINELEETENEIEKYVEVEPRQQGEPSQGEPSQGEPAQGEPSQGEPSQGEPAQGEPAQGEPAQGEPAQGEPSQGEPAQGEPAQGEPAQGEPAQGEPSQGEPAQGEPAQGEPAQGEPAQGEPTQGEPAQGQPTQGQPAQELNGKIASILYVAHENHYQVTFENGQSQTYPVEDGAIREFRKKEKRHLKESIKGIWPRRIYKCDPGLYKLLRKLDKEFEEQGANNFEQYMNIIKGEDSSLSITYDMTRMNEPEAFEGQDIDVRRIMRRAIRRARANDDIEVIGYKPSRWEKIGDFFSGRGAVERARLHSAEQEQGQRQQTEQGDQGQPAQNSTDERRAMEPTGVIESEVEMEPTGTEVHMTNGSQTRQAEAEHRRSQRNAAGQAFTQQLHEQAQPEDQEQENQTQTGTTQQQQGDQEQGNQTQSEDDREP